MAEWYQKSLTCVAASIAGLAAMLLCLGRSMVPADAQDARVLQIWPDRNIGVTSGLLEGPTVYTATQVFPLGVARTSDDGLIYARTYLGFPLDVFPPGTEVLRATLYMYVDSGSGPGEATLGAYRVLEPWEEGELDGNPETWPRLLTSPVADTSARFGAAVPTVSVPTPVITDTPTPTSTPTLTESEASMLFSRPAGHMSFSPAAQTTPTPTSSSPLPTPTLTPPTSPLPTPTAVPPTATPSPEPISTLTATLTSTPTPTPSPAGPALPIEQITGTWLTWDVTVLMRAWLMREVPDHGLALGPAPEPDADPDIAGELLVARWVAANDPSTRPYLIVEFEVHPVTPSPTSESAPVLPPAGGSAGWGAVGLLFLGAMLLIIGLGRWERPKGGPGIDVHL